jgi:sorbitol/mannitol transport system substrate-binding protein
MKRLTFPLVVAVCLSAISAYAQQKTVTICAVNNAPMVELKKLSSKFEQKNPDIKLNWVIVEENVLRQKVTLDVTQHSGLYDLVYIGLYDTPIFAKQGNLLPFEKLPADYEIDDVFKSLRDGLSYDGKLYALPFYGESSMLMYRKDLLEAKGQTMPDQPKYEDIEKIAAALADKSKGIYGIALRGLPGWGENTAYLTTLVNTFAKLPEPPLLKRTEARWALASQVSSSLN